VNKLKKILKYSFIAFFIIVFGFNLFLVYFLDDLIDSKEVVVALNSVPVRYDIDKTEYDGLPIHLNNISFKLPQILSQNKLRVDTILQSATEGTALIIAPLKDKDAEQLDFQFTILNVNHNSENFFEIRQTLGNYIYRKQLKNNRYFSIVHDIRSSRLNDMSLWNIFGNILLGFKQFHKVSFTHYSEFFYFTLNSDLQGFINPHDKKNRYSYQVFNNNEEYYIYMHSPFSKELHLELLEKIASSFKLIKDPSETYMMLKKQHTKKTGKLLPDNLLLFSMITMNGINKNDIQDLQELKQVYYNMGETYSKYRINKRQQNFFFILIKCRGYKFPGLV